MRNMTRPGPKWSTRCGRSNRGELPTARDMRHRTNGRYPAAGPGHPPSISRRVRRRSAHLSTRVGRSNLVFALTTRPFSPDVLLASYLDRTARPWLEPVSPVDAFNPWVRNAIDSIRKAITHSRQGGGSGA